MPISYVAAADFDALVDSKSRVELFKDVGDADDTASATRFARAIELASTIALSSCKQAGYNPAESTTDDMVKMVALSLLVHIAYGRKSRGIPDSIGAVLAPIPEAVRTGELPLVVEAISNDAEAVDGSSFTGATDTTTTSTGTSTITRAPVMRNITNIL